MVPDTRMRLAAVVKALDDIVTPVIPADAKFAHEQLALIKQSIRIVMDQIPHEYGFIVRDAQDYVQLAADLAAGMPEDSPARSRLMEYAERGKSIIPAEVPDRPMVENYLGGLKKDVENAVEAIFALPDETMRRTLSRLILDHSERQTLRERVWVAATGFDTDPQSLPSMEAVIYGERDSISRS